MSEKASWKRRTPCRIYDYNYKVGEGYYKPQTKYFDEHGEHRTNYSPPKHQTYAERFATDPWYGGAYGLPYASKYSAYSEPAAKSSISPKTSSVIREMKEFEREDIPLHIRASRRKKRLEDEEIAKGVVRPKFGRQASLSNNFAFRSANARMEELEKDIKRIGDELKDRPRRASLTYEAPKFDVPALTTRSVKHDVQRFAGPGGATGQRSFHTEVSNYSSSVGSKPPLAPRARKISYGDDASSYGVRSRSRKEGAIISGGGRQRSASFSEDSHANFMPGRAQKIRDEKRFKESEDFSQSVRSMIDKMRQGHIDPEDAYKYTRSNALSDYDPPRRRTSQKRPHGYSTALNQ